MRASFLLAAAILVFRFQSAEDRATWLTDEQAREVAGATVHSVSPMECYSTYRNEDLEDRLLDVRESPIVGKRINNSVYFYRVASHYCTYVVDEGGEPVLYVEASFDCCDYGTVAVGRGTRKSYWFAGSSKPGELFNDFARDQRLRPDLPKPVKFVSLYRDLIWGGSNTEIVSLGQLRDSVEQSFKSAYSFHERANSWQRKLDIWWKRFQSEKQSLRLETTYEPTTEGIVVRGFSFTGFILTSPPIWPPKGIPKLLQWTLLVKADGTVEEQPAKVIYSAP